MSALGILLLIMFGIGLFMFSTGFDEKMSTAACGILLILFSIVGAVFGERKAVNAFKDGQIAALNGDVRFELVTHENGITSWDKITQTKVPKLESADDKYEFEVIKSENGTMTIKVIEKVEEK